MKSFSQFKEDIDSMKATMKGFADTIVPQMKNFAKSKEVKDLKTVSYTHLTLPTRLMV